MFFFGFLSSTVPYIIIACLYAIGFGLYSGNKLKERITSDNEHAVVQDYTQKTNHNFLNRNQHYFYGKHVSKPNFQGSIFSESNYSLSFCNKLSHFKELYKELLSEDISFSLFSRPPPF